ncbi:MAG: hypothetical protein AAF654_14005 [Myxococcota bacterium]
MPELTLERLFHPTVPISWAPLLELLAEVESVTHDEVAPRDQRRERLVKLRTQMLAETEGLKGTLPPTHANLADTERFFCEAVLLWTMYARSGARLVYSTLESTTLPHFELDLPDEPGPIESVLDALSRAFAVSRWELARWRQDLALMTSNLELKKAIVDTLVARLRAAEDTDAAVLELFQSIYGPWPFRPGDIQIFVAEAALIFVAPFRDGKLELEGYNARPGPDRLVLDKYLRVVEAGTWKTDRFPGFGELALDALDPQFLDGLVRGLDVRAVSTAVRDTLHTMVTFLASHDVESYLIHDLWGHTWQETLGEFEWDYYRLERVVSEPVSLNTGQRDTHGNESAPGLRSAFSVVDGAIVLDEEEAIASLHRALRERVRLSLNGVVAEALADVTEFKYAYGERERGESLPSSSLLPDSPIKHDLTARDILFHYRRWRQSFRELIDDTSVRGRLSGQVAAELGTKHGAREAVDQLAELIRRELEHTALSSRRTFAQTVEGRIEIDIVQRTQAAAARLDRDITDHITRGENRLRALRQSEPDARRWRCPSACLDLLVLTLGWFFERDREVLFWHLDELIRDELPALMDRLEDALAGRP